MNSISSFRILRRSWVSIMAIKYLHSSFAFSNMFGFDCAGMKVDLKLSREYSTWKVRNFEKSSLDVCM